MDADGDGISDSDEEFFGSDPASVFRLSFENDGSGLVTIRRPVFTAGLPDVIVEECVFYKVEVTENNVSMSGQMNSPVQ